MVTAHAGGATARPLRGRVGRCCGGSDYDHHDDDGAKAPAQDDYHYLDHGLARMDEDNSRDTVDDHDDDDNGVHNYFHYARTVYYFCYFNMNIVNNGSANAGASESVDAETGRGDRRSQIGEES